MSRYIIYKFEKEFEGYTKTKKNSKNRGEANTSRMRSVRYHSRSDGLLKPHRHDTVIAQKVPLDGVCGINTNYFLHAHSYIIGA